MRILGSAVGTDRFALNDRKDPATLNAGKLSAERAYAHAGVSPSDIDFFELHDAFSIMACLALEACGFAPPGEGWKLAADEEIFREGKIPVSTMGGLKARGHPVGASALYQICEIVQQLKGTAGENQIPRCRVAMTQSIGGAGTTMITHILGTKG